MALAKNDAYAGVAEMPNGRNVEVGYFDAAKLREVFGHQPPGHPARKRIGWYWSPHDRRVDVAPGAQSRGPFTSSRLAIMDAVAKNPRREDAA